MLSIKQKNIGSYIFLNYGYKNELKKIQPAQLTKIGDVLGIRKLSFYLSIYIIK